MSPSFKILIVGGGLGGLAAAVALAQKGHQVTVLESTAKLQTIGGGITIPSNSMRVWDYLGLLKRLQDAAEMNVSETRIFKQYTGEFICDGGSRKKLYKYDNMNIHRAPLQKLLVEAATEAGTMIEVNTRVVGVDDSGPSPVAITKDGRRMEADLIIGADGAKSTLRSILHPSTELASTYNIYRAVIDGAAIGADPELAPLLDMSTLWWGPGRTVVGIPVQKKEFYSLECPHPGDTGVAGEWNKRGDLELMKKTFSDFEPTVVKLMSKVKPENLLIWKLTQLPELESWVWENGKIVLIADAAHAMMPYSGQGHAMAIEDSVCLAECLDRTISTADIPNALRAFERIRKPRTTLLGDFAKLNAYTWQLPDGEEQRKRDERLRTVPFFGTSSWDGSHVDDVPGLPPDPLFFPYVLAHDVIDFTKRQLDEIFGS